MREIFWMVAGTAALVGGVVWLTSESDADIERKPELVEQILEHSMQHCLDQSHHSDDVSTEARLTAVLEGTRSTALDFILNNNITVCLDKRLHEEDYGFWDREPQAIYYPESSVISLWDNGEETTFWNRGPARYGDSMLNEFASSFGDGFFDDFEAIENVEVPYIGYTYTTTTSNGKSSTTTRHYNFRTIESGSFSDLMDEHPSLREAPIVRAPSI